MRYTMRSLKANCEGYMFSMCNYHVIYDAYIRIYTFTFRNIESKQDSSRDNQLISRLLRETRFEKHLAAHLIAVRGEKAVMTRNREQLNQQFEEVSSDLHIMFVYLYYCIKERRKKFEEYLETVKQNETQEQETLLEQQKQVC